MMNFGNSPLLDMGTSQQQPPTMDAELQKMYEAIQQKRASINMQAQQSSTPLWDEIDKIEDNLTGAQRQYLMQNQEYVNSLQYVSKLVQDEELRIIRPRIESTQQGQEALKKHLSLMQRLRKEVAQAEEHKSAMLNDYMTNHSDKTWQEYLAWYNKTKKRRNQEMNVTELKEKLLESVDVWADARIDDMVKANPMLAIPSVYMKRAAHNIISKNKDKWDKSIDNATLFIADEDGNIDANTIFEDMMQMLKSVEDYKFDVGFIHGHIDKGVVSIDLPDGIATAILFGSKRSINFTEEDFVELKDLIIG